MLITNKFSNLKPEEKREAGFGICVFCDTDIKTEVRTREIPLGGGSWVKCSVCKDCVSKRLMKHPEEEPERTIDNKWEQELEEADNLNKISQIGFGKAMVIMDKLIEESRT